MAQGAKPTTTTLSLAAAMVALADELTGEAPPERVLDAARAVLLDHLSGPGARSDDPIVIAGTALEEALGTPAATVRVPGSERLHGAFAAAFVTAAAAGAGVSGSGESVRAGWFAAPALGAALAVGQLRPVRGVRWLTAFALGCETHLQIARALDPDLVQRGWDPTGPCGVLGAATAGAVILGADAQALAATWGAAAGQVLGHRRAAEAGLARLHAGQAAANGALAALLVDAGFTASSRVFEAPRGVLTALLGPHDSDRLLASSGTWTLPDEVQSATSPCPPADGGATAAAPPELAAAVGGLDRAPGLGDLLDALAPREGTPAR